MAFKISQKPTFITRVTVETPNQKGGFDTSHFNAEFKRIGMDVMEELRGKKQAEVLREMLVGWTDLLDDANEQVPFNDDNIVVLLNIPQALAGLSEAFWGSIFKAKEKN